jgi:hypothetical protein
VRKHGHGCYLRGRKMGMAETGLGKKRRKQRKREEKGRENVTVVVTRNVE